MSDRDVRLAARELPGGLAAFERIRAWAEAARRGDVSGPMAELEAILERAARSPGGNQLDGEPEPRRSDEGAAVGALAMGSVGWLIRSAVVTGAAGRCGWGRAGDGSDGPVARGVARGARAPGGRAVVGLAVVSGGGGLVVVGAKRGMVEAWRYASWIKPGAAWPEVGAWSLTAAGDLTAPLRRRLSSWAAAEVPDRVAMDLGTARAVALAIFDEPFRACRAIEEGI